MEPTLNIGTLIIAARVNPEQLADGDIIVFHLTAGNGTLVCHRIVEVNNITSLAFKTQGDNNPAPDSFSVPAENVAGRVIFHLPVLGYLVQFLQTGIGLLLGLVAPAVIIIVLCLRSLRQELVKLTRDKAGKEIRHE
jgi:signal peptidase